MTFFVVPVFIVAFGFFIMIFTGVFVFSRLLRVVYASIVRLAVMLKLFFVF